jgi:hypothetical protein
LSCLEDDVPDGVLLEPLGRVVVVPCEDSLPLGRVVVVPCEDSLPLGRVVVVPCEGVLPLGRLVVVPCGDSLPLGRVVVVVELPLVVVLSEDVLPFSEDVEGLVLTEVLPLFSPLCEEPTLPAERAAVLSSCRVFVEFGVPPRVFVVVSGVRVEEFLTEEPLVRTEFS